MGIFSRVTLGSGTGRATPCLAPNPGVFSRRTGGRPVRSARAPPDTAPSVGRPAPPRWSTQTVPPPARRARHCRRRNSRLPLHRARVLPTAPLRFARPARREEVRACPVQQTRASRRESLACDSARRQSAARRPLQSPARPAANLTRAKDKERSRELRVRVSMAANSRRSVRSLHETENPTSVIRASFVIRISDF